MLPIDQNYYSIYQRANIVIGKQSEKVSNERDQLRRQLTEVQTNLEFENQKIKAQLESATNNLQAQNGEVEKLKADNEEMTKKLNWIRKTKADADAEIKKLTNQVNLLKKELLK